MTPGASRATDEISRPTGSFANCSAVITVRVSTEETSIAGSAEATTETPSSVLAALGGAPNDTSVPPAMVTMTWSRELTAWPLFCSVTV